MARVVEAEHRLKWAGRGAAGTNHSLLPKLRIGPYSDWPRRPCSLVMHRTGSARSEMFFLDESHPNGLQPGRRPRTTLVNYIACRHGEPVMTFGCPGGR